MKLLKLMLFILLCFRVASAQYATLTGTITDTDGTAWANGTYKITFFPNPNQPNLSAYFLNGVPLTQYYSGPISGSLDASAHFSQGNVPATNLITPTGSSYTIQFCPNASAQCGSFQNPISGTLDISSVATTKIPAPRFPGTSGSWGYVDTEVSTTPVPGATYWNVTQLCQRFYNGSSWNCGSGGTGTGLPVNNPTFTGNLSGPTGAFTGALSAASATISGPLSATALTSTTISCGAQLPVNGASQFVCSTLDWTNGSWPQAIQTQSYYARLMDANHGYVSTSFNATHLRNGRNESWVDPVNGLTMWKPGINAINLNDYNFTPGSTYPLGIYNLQTSTGDTFGIMNLAYCYGGTTASGDEGCESWDNWSFQGSVDYQNTISSGASTGSIHLVLGTTPIQGNNTQGGGRFLVDLNATHLIKGTINNITGNGIKTFTQDTGGTSWPVSTVNTTTSGVINGSQNIQTVTLASTTNITVGTVLCLADQYTWQTVAVTAVSGNTVSGLFRKSQTSGAAVMAGGLCGSLMSIDVDNAAGGSVGGSPAITGTLIVGYPILGTTNSTNALVWLAQAGTWVGYPGAFNTTNTGDNTYTIYPMAEVLDVTNGNGSGNLLSLTNIFDLYPNTVAWATGDTVDLPVYPFIAQQVGNDWVQRNFAGSQTAGVNFSFGPYWASTIGMGGVGSGAIAETWTNQTAASYYSIPARKRGAPSGITYNGAWSSGLTMWGAPTSAMIYVGNCNLISGCGVFSFLTSRDNSGNTDSLQYDQVNHNWKMTTAGGVSSGQQYEWNFAQNSLINHIGQPASIGSNGGLLTLVSGGAGVSLANGVLTAPAGKDIYIQSDPGQQLNLVVPNRNLNINAGSNIVETATNGPVQITSTNNSINLNAGGNTSNFTSGGQLTLQSNNSFVNIVSNGTGFNTNITSAAGVWINPANGQVNIRNANNAATLNLVLDQSMLSGGVAWTISSGGPGATGTPVGAGDFCIQSSAHCMLYLASGGLATFYNGVVIPTTLTAASNQFRIDTGGSIHTTGTSPSVSAGTIQGSNMGGVVSGLSAASSLTLSFAGPGWTVWSACTAAIFQTSGLGTSTIIVSIGTETAGSVTFEFSAPYTGNLNYNCTGN